MTSRQFLSDPAFTLRTIAQILEETPLEIKELADKMRDPIRKSLEGHMGYIINVVLPRIAAERRVMMIGLKSESESHKLPSNCTICDVVNYVNTNATENEPVQIRENINE